MNVYLSLLVTPRALCGLPGVDSVSFPVCSPLALRLFFFSYRLALSDSEPPRFHKQRNTQGWRTSERSEKEDDTNPGANKLRSQRVHRESM
ncbi:hypothetical protein BHE74_00006327 [Ensete ventricosum]|uniref:Uncharacterized protein n=1 Tax=Ensete ventricosum TaxID=4639 RepID=A0A426XDM6_ENSVE|nr:hypothetical protein B296_00025031 [Ensete ventricosum]RWW85034.1 hypothetical protein BHE74_00006327 [Ensete ventricosum]RZR80247.1 hypothetical protein BHM03_00006217 [Ensete ventricosum]